MLKNTIKKSLLETKEKKEKHLIEENLIKNRFSVVLEGVKTEKDFKNLSEKKQLKLSVKFIQEMSFLKEVGFINEQEQDNWGELLTKMFGNSFNSIAETMIEPFIRSILSGLGFEEGFVRNFLVSYLTSRPNDIINSFNDCRLMTKLITEGIVESMVITTQREKGYSGFGYNLIRNKLGEVLKGSEFSKRIEHGLEEKVCSILTKLVENTKSVVEKLKPVLNNVG
jgi:hypothetical protein